MLDAISPLNGFDETRGGIRLWERAELALVSIALPRGGEDVGRKAIKQAYKLDLPEVGLSTADKRHRLIRLSPDQAMLVFADDAPLAEPAVQAKLKGACYTTNQTDAWVALSIEGPTVRDALERLCPLDMHPDRFAINAAQRTVMEHMGAVICREAEDRFLLLSASSSAQSFLHAFTTSVQYAT
ncbi:Sarcosine oxidase gamma subunit [Candidatus Rhodobacter oscarellae]|uniref:Sarcosine oxidase gamma subunit n=1 Tax=Candidatus Rhodobacter oscarellae TaxID=1675527 RepID=A0A0J9GTI1_9RHOB|nr:sarcosine oxidase subunit gamma family protein [Candidatus Rhodobacter lobularis]KMW56808.1 Sarcosine oxidase gamma subunit [Candidatus Rhodobacter lobularis]